MSRPLSRPLSVLGALLFAAAPLSAQAQAPQPKVEVPTFANATCPIMGKKVSMPLFVDTEKGRIYLCCKPCIKKVLANVDAAHLTAYPKVETIANTTCPVSGEPLGKDAVAVTLQGFAFQVCCAGCIDDARKHSQATLVKLRRPGVVDVGNTTCPVSGEPVVANAYALVGDRLVHLAQAKLVAEVEKAPAAVLAKAEALAKAQPKPPKHSHRGAAEASGQPAKENGK